MSVNDHLSNLETLLTEGRKTSNGICYHIVRPLATQSIRASIATDSFRGEIFGSGTSRNSIHNASSIQSAVLQQTAA
jgi:hypothetical protein